MLVEFLLQFRCGARVSLRLTDLRFTIEKFAAVPSPRVPNREIFPSDQSVTLSDKRREAGQGKSCDAKMCRLYKLNIRDIVLKIRAGQLNF